MRRLHVRHPDLDFACERLETAGAGAGVVAVVGVVLREGFTGSADVGVEFPLRDRDPSLVDGCAGPPGDTLGDMMASRMQAAA